MLWDVCIFSQCHGWKWSQSRDSPIWIQPLKVFRYTMPSLLMAWWNREWGHYHILINLELFKNEQNIDPIPLKIHYLIKIAWILALLLSLHSIKQSISSLKSRARFLSLARSKLRLCSANHRPGYWSNLPCDWPSTVWACSEQETENGPSTTRPMQCLSSLRSHLTTLSRTFNHYNNTLKLEDADIRL